MKRVPDVLSSPDLTKKVLREVCILRRLNHPFIISLRDAFLRPSASGALSDIRLALHTDGLLSGLPTTITLCLTTVTPEVRQCQS